MGVWGRRHGRSVSRNKTIDSGSQSTKALPLFAAPRCVPQHPPCQTEARSISTMRSSTLRPNNHQRQRRGCLAFLFLLASASPSLGHHAQPDNSRNDLTQQHNGGTLETGYSSPYDKSTSHQKGELHTHYFLTTIGQSREEHPWWAIRCRDRNVK